MRNSALIIKKYIKIGLPNLPTETTSNEVVFFMAVISNWVGLEGFSGTLTRFALTIWQSTPRSHLGCR